MHSLPFGRNAKDLFISLFYKKKNCSEAGSICKESHSSNAFTEMVFSQCCVEIWQKCGKVKEGTVVLMATN